MPSTPKRPPKRATKATKGRPSVQFMAPKDVGPRDWGRELLLVETEHYLAKMLKMRAGTAGGLQYHRRKLESFVLVRGSAVVDYDDGTGRGTLVSRGLVVGELVHVPVGAVHRVRAITDALFYEWSTPVFNDRVRVEAEYGEPDTGGLPTTP